MTTRPGAAEGRRKTWHDSDGHDSYSTVEIAIALSKQRGTWVELSRRRSGARKGGT